MGVVAGTEGRATRRGRRPGGLVSVPRIALATLLAATLLPVPADAQVGDDAQPPSTGALEGRPEPGRTSPLQSLVDAAAPGDRIVVPAGTYEGDLLIDKAISLVGDGRPVLRGSGTGSVVRIRAAGATIEGFDIDGRRGGDLGRDTSGVHVAAPRATIRDCRIRDALFGIYLRESDDAVLEGNTIVGIPDRPPGEVGSGIHIWNSQRYRVTGNQIVGTRDGMYIQSSSHGVIRGNRARDLRYGLHYMFSDDNLFEDNSFETGAAGAALMYSERITFRRNRFLRNRGFASVGLLLKECDDLVAEDNLMADNARGIFLEGSHRNSFRRNIVAMSDIAVVIYDSSRTNVFEDNAFVGNLSPLSLVGRRTDTRFAGNYWSDHGEPDLDGDGIAERPYRLSNVFDHLRGNLTAADLFAQGMAARALGAAERAFPVLDAVPVLDERPLARMPRLADVPDVTPAPEPAAEARTTSLWPAVMVMAGAFVLIAGGRSPLGRRAGAQGGAA
ncbi:MAG: nitrous oxide reductase family maturation protein NosD [Acidobacteria bacterium]|nr:nitrous oxide reductase family maturation protein NosD [Acidobacteriota bacterium]